VFPLKDNIPTDRFPVLTVALIVANVLVYLVFQKAIGSGLLNSPDEANLLRWGAYPYELTHPGEQCLLEGTQIACRGGIGGEPPALLTALSSMFMHGGLLHLGGNMLFLWIFGNNVEDRMGRGRFLLFYLLGGIAAIAAQTAIGPDEAVPTVGASGAVAGVLGGYLLLYPRARVLTLIFLVFFFTIVELPALLILGFWFVQQVLFGYFDLADPAGGGGGVAYFAHIGGFAFGLLAIRLFARGRRDHDERHDPQPVFRGA